MMAPRDKARVLVLHPHLPYPPSQGADIRNYRLLKWLSDRFEVDLVAFSDEPVAPDSPLPGMVGKLMVRPFPKRSLARRALSTFFSSRPDMALRLFDRGMLEEIASTVRSSDYAAIHIEGIEMAPYGFAAAEMLERRGSRTKIVFDDHNAEYMLQRSAFLTDVRNPLRFPGAVYSFLQWRKLARYERSICSKAWKVIGVSRKDAEAIESLVPGLSVIVIPNGVDVPYYRDYPAVEDTAEPTLVFTGKMDYRPNVDAMLWFVSEIWPSVKRRRPDVKLVVVGQKPHPKLRGLGKMPGVSLTGFVPDVRPFMASASVFVVPLRMGSGTRLKVLQAMAMGKAIVSTSVGAEGLGVENGRELLLADSPEDFADAVVALLDDEALRRRLGAAAMEFVSERFDWSVIVPKMAEVYGEVS